MFFSFLLESIFTNIFKEFIPFFIIGSIAIISRFNLDTNKKYIFIFIVGVLYDLLYTNLLFINGFIFCLILFISNLILNKSNNFLKMIFTYYLEILIYSLIMFIYVVLSTNINLYNLVLQIINSIYINSIYFIITYIIFIGIICLIKNKDKKRAY